MKIKTLNEWLNESNQGFLLPTRENLRKYGLDPNKTTVTLDGSIDYKGDVDLSLKNLTSIPFNFNKVNGYFYCFENRLVSLAGAPEVVEGDFYCNDNQLINLAGAPKSVGGDFNCTYNRLVSLAGAPEFVHILRFNCSDNLILYNPILYVYESPFKINEEWPIRDSSGKLVWYSGSDHLRMAFGRLDELTMEEIIGIEEGLKKVDLPDDLRAYCEKELYKFLVKYNPQTKTQKFFHDAEMDDDVMDML